MGSKIWRKEISQIGPMPPHAARLLRILGGLTRQSEGRLGEPVKSRSSTWRASNPLLCNNSASTITISPTGWLVASAFLHGLSTASRAGPRRLAVPASFAFSRLPVGYLYERGDR